MHQNPVGTRPTNLDRIVKNLRGTFVSQLSDVVPLSTICAIGELKSGFRFNFAVA
jgi:hypothetical protein